MLVVGISILVSIYISISIIIISSIGISSIHISSIGGGGTISSIGSISSDWK